MWVRCVLGPSNGMHREATDWTRVYICQNLISDYGASAQVLGTVGSGP